LPAHSKPPYCDIKQLEDSADHHHELTALTDTLTALKILGETNWAE